MPLTILLPALACTSSPTEEQHDTAPETSSTVTEPPDDTGPPDSGMGETGSTDSGDGPCDPSPAIAGQTTELDLKWDGVVRTYMVHLPASYDCTPLPVVMGLHGYYGSGFGFENNTAKMSDHLEARGYIGLFPNGLSMSLEASEVTSFNDLGSRNDDGPDGQTCGDKAWDYGAFENCGASEEKRVCRWGTSCADDEGFFREVITQAKSQWSVDAERVFLTGFSQGGQTTQSMACPMSDVFAAVAPIHGFSANGYTCAPDTAMSMMQVWGQWDVTVPGTGLAGDGYIYDEASETALEWATAQGCEKDGTTSYPTKQDGNTGWACTEHADCETGAEVVTCSWFGGHVWPGGKEQNFILDSIWAFFEANPRK